jgi:site-specific recombinase XerD
LAKAAKAQGVQGTPYLREAVEDWLAYLTVERQLAANTAESYERDIASSSPLSPARRTSSPT